MKRTKNETGRERKKDVVGRTRKTITPAALSQLLAIAPLHHLSLCVHHQPPPPSTTTTSIQSCVAGLFGVDVELTKYFGVGVLAQCGTQ